MSLSPDKTPPEHPNAATLLSATKGFDYLFSNNIAAAKKNFQPYDDPFHLLGMGVCAFLEAALSLEAGLMPEASRLLALAEAGSRKQMRVPKPPDLGYHSRFHYGLEWEILNADAVVLLGLTNALSESYMGYLQCMYALNNGHSKFTKLYKTVFPNGLPSTIPLDGSHTAKPSSNNLTVSPRSPSLSHNASAVSLLSVASVSSNVSSATVAGTSISPTKPTAAKGSFFSRWSGTATASTPAIPLEVVPDGPVEDLIVSGTAFGFGLFNLVFSLLPKKVQGLVGFFGFQHDRKLALQSLAVSASKLDVHGVSAGLVLMTYMGVVLLLSGYQANEEKLLKDYHEIVDRVESKYPSGALWILNRAKFKRMGYDAEGAIRVLQDGLKPDRPHTFVQADVMLYFELGWILLGQRRYLEAADAFMKLTELNSWSHGTYYFIAAGCHLAEGNLEKAQTLMDAIPDLIDKKKLSGKDLPTEVLIKKKLAFYKEKQARRGGDEKKWIEVVKINPTEELGIFWNTHARIAPSIAQAHIDAFTALTPPPAVHELPLNSPMSPPGSSKFATFPSTPKPNDLDTTDELAIRAVLLGVNYRTVGSYKVARGFLAEAQSYAVEISSWVGGIAMFELAVLDLKEAEASSKISDVADGEKERVWTGAFKSALNKLDLANSLSGSSVDLSSRLDSRITMLKDQIAEKKELLGIKA